MHVSVFGHLLFIEHISNELVYINNTIGYKINVISLYAVNLIYVLHNAYFQKSFKHKVSEAFCCLELLEYIKKETTTKVYTPF